MKLVENEKTRYFPNTGPFNVFSLGAISLTWGHMLGLASLWLLPLTILFYMIGYGSEAKPMFGFKHNQQETSMAGLQTIIDNCDSIEIDRRKVVGIQITRNEVARTSETPTFQPWRIKLTMPSRFKYNQVRSLLEALDTLDRNTPEIVTFGNVACLSWIFKYQGTMTQTALNNITVTSFVGNQLVLGNLPVLPSTRVLFEPNDLIQIGNNPYPFTSTTQVTRGTGATVTVTTNRPNILTSAVAGDGITVGNSCEFNMFCPNMPIYKLMPGGYMQQNGVTTNNALIEFSDSFDLYEWVATA